MKPLEAVKRIVVIVFSEFNVRNKVFAKDSPFRILIRRDAIKQRDQLAELIARTSQPQIEWRPQFLARFRLHAIARFVIEPRERNAKLQEQRRARRKLLFEEQYLPAGIFNASDAEVAQDDDKHQQQGAADQQRHQRWIQTRLVWTGSLALLRSRSHPAINDLALGCSPNIAFLFGSHAMKCEINHPLPQ